MPAGSAAVAASVSIDCPSLNVTVDDEDQGKPPGAAAAPRASNRGVAAMAAAHGTKLVLERYVCDLRRMGCGWEEVEDGAAQPKSDSKVRSRARHCAVQM